MKVLVEKIRSTVAVLISRLLPIRPSDADPILTFDASDFEDRREWNRAWGNQSHRHLNTPLKIDLTNDLSRAGSVISATISEDPPEFSDRAFRQSDECPVCGRTTVGMSRRAASVHPEFENGLRNISFGVWVHNDCFESCPDTGRPAPIPW
ncbi:MAG TPA: hypothetical protein VFD58_24210 [Blastocatellia bacterium]|nr:hypothetical protein [Blastocatellia bacterium]